MRDFKFGDRVIYTGELNGYFFDKGMIGCIGTVNGDIGETNVPVLFDEDGKKRQWGVYPDNIRHLMCEKAKELI